LKEPLGQPPLVSLQGQPVQSVPQPQGLLVLQGQPELQELVPPQLGLPQLGLQQERQVLLEPLPLELPEPLRLEQVRPLLRLPAEGMHREAS
jgi:hypothetical protein